MCHKMHRAYHKVKKKQPAERQQLKTEKKTYRKKPEEERKIHTVKHPRTNRKQEKPNR